MWIQVTACEYSEVIETRFLPSRCWEICLYRAPRISLVKVSLPRCQCCSFVHLDFRKFYITTIEIQVPIVYENQTSVLLAKVKVILQKKRRSVGRIPTCLHWWSHAVWWANTGSLKPRCVGESLSCCSKARQVGILRYCQIYLEKGGTEFYYESLAQISNLKANFSKLILEKLKVALASSLLYGSSIF